MSNTENAYLIHLMKKYYTIFCRRNVTMLQNDVDVTVTKVLFITKRHMAIILSKLILR